MPAGEIRGQFPVVRRTISRPFLRPIAPFQGATSPAERPPCPWRAGEAFANLINQGVLVGLGAGAGGVRVIPNDSANSVLFLKVSGATAGPQMPIGRSPLPVFDQDLIKVWIDMGAENN